MDELYNELVNKLKKFNHTELINTLKQTIERYYPYRPSAVHKACKLLKNTLTKILDKPDLDPRILVKDVQDKLNLIIDLSSFPLSEYQGNFF